MTLVGDTFRTANPDAVKGFVAATIAGWKDYLRGDAAPGDALIVKDNPDMTPDLLAQAREKLLSYRIVEAEDGSIGNMTSARWEEFFQIMVKAGVVADDLNWKNNIDLSFLPKA
jgi:NitT/TauT family transport system substrate-binding protein